MDTSEREETGPELSPETLCHVASLELRLWTWDILKDSSVQNTVMAKCMWIPKNSHSSRGRCAPVPCPICPGPYPACLSIPLCAGQVPRCHRRSRPGSQQVILWPACTHSRSLKVCPGLRKHFDLDVVSWPGLRVPGARGSGLMYLASPSVSFSLHPHFGLDVLSHTLPGHPAGGGWVLGVQLCW